MKTNSIPLPNMFNVAQNQVAVVSDANSVANRCRLLILTEPTEIYNEPDQGVGLKRHLFKYNNENERAIIKDRIIEQLRKHEPQCIPDNTQFSDNLLFTELPDNSFTQKYNRLDLTVAIQTTFGATVNIDLDLSSLEQSLYDTIS